MAITVPKVTIKLSGRKYFNDELSCMDEQLVKMLLLLRLSLTDYDWHVFDVSATSLEAQYPFMLSHSNAESMVLSTHDLIDKANKIVQFDSGVFMAFHKKTAVHWDIDDLPYTEAEEGLQHPLAALEIRAFDYCYFEFYTNVEELTALVLNELSQ